jgi:hypothetical protein
MTHSSRRRRSRAGSKPRSLEALVTDCSSEVFDALGIVPVIGRALEPSDSRPGAARVAVIGYQMWRQRLGGDARAVGRGIRIGAHDYQIVGVAPQGFHFPPNAPTDVILPPVIPLEAPAGRQSDWTFSAARLKPGMALEAAVADLSAVSTQLAQEYPSQNQASQYYAVRLRDAAGISRRCGSPCCPGDCLTMAICRTGRRS